MGVIKKPMFRIFRFLLQVRVKIYRAIILPPVWVHGSETRSLTIMDQHGLRIFEVWAQRKYIWIEDGITTDWRKLHNEAFRNLYPSPDIVRMTIHGGLGEQDV
jgi:hypothetical protein